MSNPNKQKIIEHLKLLEFDLIKTGEFSNWTKTYKDCEIKVDLESGWIDYPPELTVHNQSTSRLLDDESFVVLECVDRLLKTGYPSEKIELEKTWKVGKNSGGRIDILVRCEDSDEIYLMIECKTYKSYDNALIDLKFDGGQLFSYLQQDQSAKFLCLYSSWIYHFKIRHKYSVVPVTQPIGNSKNRDEMFENWNKMCITGGDLVDDVIWGESIPPYGIIFSSKTC